MQWLAEFQILACIPLNGNVPLRGVAELAGVPHNQLARIVRLTATSGFLREPEPDLVAHTPLSAQFIADHCFFDAALFLTESITPAAMQMLSATQRFGASRDPSECAYNLAVNSVRPFHLARLDRPRLDRKWVTFLSHAAGLHGEKELVDVFSQLNWLDLGNACIVEVK